jgi:hypothetical protein
VDFDSFMGQAWDEHGEQPAAVAARIETEGLALLRAVSEGQDKAIARLAHLAQHVHGGHLAQWQRGLRLQETLIALPACTGTTATQLRRAIAGLALGSGEPGARAALPPAERVAAAALAASNLAEHDAARAETLLATAAAEEAALALPDTHPAVRALAIAGNNIAGALEERPTRSAAERSLMIAGAEAGLRYWARAGTWLEIERAEYRLSRSWCIAGEPEAARQHAHACLRVVAENGNAALEAFFGHEALALAEHAAGVAAARDAAVAAAGADFERLDESDRGWCGATLARLRAL